MAAPYLIPTLPERSAKLEWVAVVGLVVLLHGLLIAAYWTQPAAPAVQVNEMSISFASMQLPQAEVAPRPKALPRHEPRDAAPLPAEAPAVKEQTPPAVPDVTPPSPVVLDAEPDYRADYLNNPRPPYPLLARRMGYHGKVILNVEVLADGKAGQVLLHQSCGHEMLDNAALQTVKMWRFTPARRLGQPVTQWFLVPIKFSLEGNAE